MAALVGRQARVVRRSPATPGGCGSAGRWSARAHDETLVIPAGTTVDVIEIEGATALVYRGSDNGSRHRRRRRRRADRAGGGPLGADRAPGAGPQRGTARPPHQTLEPGLHFIIPFVDRVRSQIDLREQVVSFPPQPVITEDNLVVNIDTVLLPRHRRAGGRLRDLQLHPGGRAAHRDHPAQRDRRDGPGGDPDLREKINSELRGVLDEATGKWGIRVNRVEIKAIDPPAPIKQAMEKQMRADRDKRAAILTAEGVRQSQILTAEEAERHPAGRGQAPVGHPRGRGPGPGDRDRVPGRARNDPDPKLAYQYLQTLPQLAQSPGSTFWVIPSEVTSALRSISRAFGDEQQDTPPETRRIAPPRDGR